MMIVKFGFFSASMLGSMLFARRVLSLQVEFLPILYCAFVSNTMFLAGIFNIMPEMVTILWMAGILSLVYELLKNCRLMKREWIFVIAFFGTIVYFSWLLRGSHFTHYDNFSHWATVVKDMLLHNRMPNFEDKLVTFQAYPLGSSLFIYYVCKIVGMSDACFSWGQMLMLISSIFAGTAFLKKKNSYMVLPWICYGIYVLVANISIYDLLVDTLLPLVGAASWAMILEYQDRPKAALFCVAWMFPFLVNIKNSGIFFFMICLIELIFCLWQQRKTLWKQIVLCGGAPAICILALWKKHVALVFASGATTKHAMSLANYKNVFKAKDTEDILAVLDKWWETFWDLQNQSIQMFIYLVVFILFVWLVYAMNHQAKQYKKKAFGLLGISFGVLMVYQLGILGMYLFSMPGGEALSLAGYGRYQITGNQFALGIILFSVMRDLSSFDAKAKFHVCLAKVCIIIVCVFPAWNISSRISQLYKKQAFEKTERYILQNLIREYHLNDTGNYLFYKKESSSYIYYMSRYELWNSQVKETSSLENDEINRLKTYDCLILWDEPEEGYEEIDNLEGGPKIIMVEP